MLKVFINILLINSLLLFEVFNCAYSSHVDVIKDVPKATPIVNQKDIKKRKSIKSKWLPGMVQVKQNLFFDKGEITNFNWVEYLSWLEKIYGKNSEKYKNALPNPDVWADLGEQYAALDSTYLYLPKYREHPVVGVSYQQALKFSQWRADRVMQIYLIKKKIIDYHSVKDQDSIFTIEKYFKGEYLGYKPSNKIYFYPEFSLPDSASYFKFNHFSDSLNTSNYKTCKRRDLSNNLLVECNCFKSNSSDQQEFQKYGTVPTKSNDISSCRKEVIAHLKGNVREMTDKKNVFYGLSFIDSCNKDYNQLRTDSVTVNSYTGFRNICQYKDWRNDN